MEIIVQNFACSSLMQKAIFPFIAVEILSKKFLKLSFKLHLYLKGCFVHTGICVQTQRFKMHIQMNNVM